MFYSSKKSKKIEAFILSLILVFATFTGAWVWAADEELHITTTALPRGRAGEVYPGVRLEAAGGSGEGYKFKIQSGRLYEGLSLSEDGMISGTPKTGGASNITFCVEDSNGNTATKRFTLRISSQTVNFTVTNNSYIYNGEPHTANVKPNIPLQESDYTILYGGADSQTACGQYLITARINRIGYVAGNISTPLIISRNTESAVNLESQTFEYDGQAHPLVPTVTLSGETLTLDQLEGTSESVRVTYVGINGTNYPLSENAPVDSGIYRVTAALSSPGYTERTTTATLTIAAPRVDFVISGDMDYEYDGSGHKLDVKPILAEGAESVNFYVRYDNLATEGTVEDDEEVVNAGKYRLYVTFDDVNHAVGSITHTSGSNATVVTVRPRIVDFTVEDAVVDYNSEEQKAKVTPLMPAGVPEPEFDVTYINAAEENAEALRSVSKPGIYDINIAIDNTNYEVGDYSPKTFTINARTVNFSVDTDSLHTVYNGKPYQIKVNANSADISEGDYKVIYDNVDTADEERLTEVINAGRYAVNVELNDKNIFAEVPDVYLIVDKKPVDFEVREATVTYTGEPQKANVRPAVDSVSEEGVTETEYTYEVTYTNVLAEEGTIGESEVSAVGTYNINVAVTGENHTFGKFVGDSVFTIAPRIVNFEITSMSAVYDGNSHRAVVAIAPDYEGEALIEDIDYKVTYTEVGIEGAEALTEVIDAGRYSIDIEFTDKTYAAGNIDGAEFVVQKRPVSFAVANENKIYNGELQKAEVTPIADDAGLPVLTEFVEDIDYRVTYVSTAAGGDETVLGETSVSEIGTYKINVDVLNGNYEFADITGGNDIFTISHRALVFSVSDAVKTYNGGAQKANVEIKDTEGNELPDGITWKAAYSSKDAADESGVFLSTDAVTDAGIYNINIEFTGENADKYTAVFEIDGEVAGNAQFIINPKTVFFEVKDNVYPYDGAAHKAAVTMLPDQGEDIPEHVIKYDHTEDEAFKGLDAASEIGKYNIVIEFGSKNYKAVAASGSELALYINRKSVVFEIANAEKEYNGSAQTADVVPVIDEGQSEDDIPEYRVTYTVNMPDGSEEKTDAVTDAGIYTIGVEFTGSNAGEFSAEFVSADGSTVEPVFTIIPKQIKVILSETEHTYDSTSHSAIVTYAAGQDISELPETPSVTYDNIATPDKEAFIEVMEIGEYFVNIDLGSDNYEAVAEDGSELIYVISRKAVIFAVSNLETVYNAEKQQANVVLKASESASSVEPVETVQIPDYRIMYDNQKTDETETDEAVTNAGIYTIYVEFTGESADEYAAVFEGEGVTDGVAVFTVAPKEILYNVTDAGAFVYDAKSHRVKLALVEGQDTEGAVLPDPNDISVTYDNKDTPDNDGLEAVTDAGIYDVNVYLGSDNFKAVAAEGSEFKLVITPKEVVMAVSENTVDMGQTIPPYSAVLTPADLDDAVAQLFKEFTVIYTETLEDGSAGTVYDGFVMTAGVYKISVNSNDKNYTAALADEDAVFTVTYEGRDEGAPMPVHFTITGSKAEYNSDITSYEAIVTPMIEDFKEYTVNYYAAGDTEHTEALSEISIPGKYDIEIIVTSENHKLGLINTDDGSGIPVFILTNPVTITIENGNSIGARLIGEDESGKTLENFRSTRIFEDVYYSEKAWEEGQDLDTDIKAFFITPYIFELGSLEEVRVNIADMVSALTYEASYAYGSEVPDIRMTIEGSTIEEWAETVGYDDNGVYDVKYSYYDEIESKEIVLETKRKIVLLISETGDANGDRNLNTGDVNYLRRKVVGNEAYQNPDANERLWLYRICDANHDGNVDTEDVNSVIRRMSEPIINFYNFY